ncbi:MAG: DNA-directed RNA polymerase subunit N [Candidatus Diapherotrites archaeon]
MIVPMRCFSCGKPVADYYEEFAKRVQKREDPEKVLDDLGLTRYCCRRTLFAHVELIDEVMKYKV